MSSAGRIKNVNHQNLTVYNLYFPSPAAASSKLKAEEVDHFPPKCENEEKNYGALSKNAKTASEKAQFSSENIQTRKNILASIEKTFCKEINNYNERAIIYKNIPIAENFVRYRKAQSEKNYWQQRLVSAKLDLSNARSREILAEFSAAQNHYIAAKACGSEPRNGVKENKNSLELIKALEHVEKARLHENNALEALTKAILELEDAKISMELVKIQNEKYNALYELQSKKVRKEEALELMWGQLEVDRRIALLCVDVRMLSKIQENINKGLEAKKEFENFLLQFKRLS